MTKTLFSTGRVSNFFGEKEKKASREIKNLNKQEIKKEEAIQGLKEKYKFKKVKLGEQRRERGEEKDQGKELIVKIPYEGDKSLLKYTPSKHKSRFPRVDSYSENNIVLKVIVSPSDSADEIEEEINEKIQFIKEYLEPLNEDIEQYNKKMESKIESKIESRRKKLDSLNSMMDELIS